MRGLLGVFAGLIVAAGLIAGLAWANNSLFGAGAIDPTDVDAIRAAIAVAPPEAQTMVLGGYFLGALGGGLVAKRIGRGWMWGGWIVAMLVLGFSGAMLALVPHPLWMQIASVAAPLLAGMVVQGA